MEIVTVVAKTPLSAAGIVVGWLPVLLLTFVLRRYTKRLLPLELCWWFAAFFGIGLSSIFNYSMLDRPWHVEFEARSPLEAFVYGSTVTAIISVIWPLMWGFFLLWFANVPEMQAKILWQFLQAGSCAAVLSAGTTWALRARDRRLAANRPAT